MALPAAGNRVGRWVQGARPRTLPAAVVPVAVGTAVAAAYSQVIWWRAAAALAVALALQVGVNYANDYSDGVRGADTRRVGPTRLVASGLASPRAVKAAAWSAFAVAGVAGLALTVAVGPQLLPVGVASVLAAWFYTGGPRPYGYAGYGELFVFVFFGLVACAGTAYVQMDRLTGPAVLAAVPVGLLSVALLVVNNLRDIAGDNASGKRTLAVRMGPPATRTMYQVCLLAPFALVGALAPWRPWALIALAALPVAAVPARRVAKGATGAELVAVLGATGRLQLLFGALLTAGLAL